MAKPSPKKQAVTPRPPRNLPTVPPSGFITLAEASGIVGKAVVTVRGWAKSGRVPSMMIAGKRGPTLYVEQDALVRYAATVTPGRPRQEHATVKASEWRELIGRITIEMERRAEAEKQLGIETFKREQAERRVAELAERLQHRRWGTRG